MFHLIVQTFERSINPSRDGDRAFFASGETPNAPPSKAPSAPALAWLVFAYRRPSRLRLPSGKGGSNQPP